MLTNPRSDVIDFQTTLSCLFPNTFKYQLKSTWEPLIITLHTFHGKVCGILKKPTTTSPQES